MKTGKTFIISGPSGVGKSTVLRELLRDRDDLYFSISATTRTPREGEINGVHYHFINVDRFREMIQEDEFLEYAEYVGNFYGTPKRYVDEAMAQGKDVILDIEVQGALQVIGKRPDTVRIFIAPPSWDALEQRLTAKMEEVLQSTTIDEARILTEAAIFADKIAVDEETVRLRSHVSQLRTMLVSDEPMGRKMDFLIQEVNRESNTIGSKCNDITIARDVVALKAEVEKIREQVQNIE